MFRPRAVLAPLGVTILALLYVVSLKAADGDIRIHDPYVRLPPPGAAAVGAFMRIENNGQAERQLLKAESPAAKTVELHTHINDNGIMKMRAVPSIGLKAGGEAVLKPGSLHIMLIGLQREFKEGDLIPIVLRFDEGFTQQIEAPVRKIEAPGTMHGGAKH